MSLTKASYSMINGAPPNVVDDGAIGNGVTSDAAAFALTEATPTSVQSFALENGLYVSGLAVATKNYEGSGAIKLSNGRNVPGKIPEIMQARYRDPMHKANASATNGGPKNIVFVGDSITYGYGVTEAQAYTNLLATRLTNQGPGVNVDRAIGCTMLNRATPSGSVATGTKGPLRQSMILAVGASLTFSVSNSDFFGFWFQRSAGAGTITVTVDGATVNTFSTAGASADDVFYQGAFKRTGSTASTVVMTASVAPVELTGVFFSRTIGDNQISLINQSASGYATADFTSSSVLTSIGVQTPYNGTAYPVYVVALGTNDIYNPSAAVSSATFKSNLDTICQGLRYYGMPVLTVPLRANQTTFSPVLESFENYRNAVYEVARKYGYYVIDLSMYDLSSTAGYQADGLHPNVIGNGLLASIYWDELELYAVNYQMPSGALTLEGAYTAFGSNYDIPAFDMQPNGMVTLSGFVNTNGSAKVTTITTLPQSARPAKAHLFVVGGLNGAAGASATVQVNESGTVVMFDYSSAALTQVSLDGISFSTLR